VTSVALVFYEYFELEKEDAWNRLTLSVPDEEIRRAHYIINICLYLISICLCKPNYHTIANVQFNL
jgi:hypothetical protein